MTTKAGQQQHGGLGLALDFGPLLVFFLTFKFIGLIAGTVAFMAAIVVAVLVSRWKLGKVSPMLWLSAALVLGFGTLTIYFNDPKFIQIKPTIIYTMFSVLLFGGLLTGKPLMKNLMQAAMEGLSDEGWMKFSRNWAIFFAAMALINEAMRLTLDFDLWLTLKVWGVTVLSMLFMVANVPMMIRHGLTVSAEDAAESAPPQG
ncbi:septation protein IspZ [Sphingomonas sp. LaA6.9]|uniref:septation protein IspZ n=1 Tax=Sphingomonas sp. LaA6.9 TaxID=2919914 RepID=UPI001F501CF0|nr:septation protein IspZ [Sphingomonas sp. LaA6.9]MCJ8157831.1 septation protein IspZ [Sphingomonas sp. LaA6.9]